MFQGLCVCDSGFKIIQGAYIAQVQFLLGVKHNSAAFHEMWNVGSRKKEERRVSGCPSPYNARYGYHAIEHRSADLVICSSVPHDRGRLVHVGV